MPLSTSSSNRTIPDRNWPVSFVIGALLAVVVLGVWEAKVRAMGYAPSLNDTEDLWAESLSRLKEQPNGTVIVGASRILFDYNQSVHAEHYDGPKPVQLALPGSKPLPMLEHVAAQEDFKGRVIVGVTPGLYFSPDQAFPNQNSLNAIKRFENWSPSQKMGHFLGKQVQRRLAFVEREDLTLVKLMESMDIPNREAAVPNIPPRLPRYFASTDGDRQAAMWDQCYVGSPRAVEIQEIWMPLFTPPPPPPHLTPEEFKAGFMESVKGDLERSAAAVKKIQDRGGQVVFVRCPSTGKVRELENQFSPRQGFWDQLLAATGAPGVHFEDYEELNGFECPEWSHLTAADAVVFTKSLLPVIDGVLE